MAHVYWSTYVKFNGESFIVATGKPKFKIGEIVLYQNGTSFELGEIKEVIEVTTSRSTVDSSTITVTYKYRVWYHTGSTTAMTDEYLLHKLINAYAFDIVRKKVDDE